MTRQLMSAPSISGGVSTAIDKHFSTKLQPLEP